MEKIELKLFLNTEEEREVKDGIKYLMKKQPPEICDFVESGGFGVRVDDILDGGTIIFDVYRTVATVVLKQKKNHSE
jgi:hypothetical protein